MRKTTFQLIFCSFAPVGLQDYVRYFGENFLDFVYLQWKFPHGKGAVRSVLKKYKNGSLEKEQILFSLPSFRDQILYFFFLPLNYLIYALQAFFFLWQRPSKVRVFIGVNYFCTFCGIVLKKLGRVDFVVYRVMDFFPLPPSGVYRILNRVFYILDAVCLRSADSLWFTTEGHIIGREKYGYFDRADYDYKLIPLGLRIKEAVSLPLKERDPYSLVYCGVISRYHLLDLVFAALEDLKKDFPGIHLKLIGTGPDEGYFKKLVRKMDLKENVTFYGYMEEGGEFTKLMATSLLGIALYKDEENFMKYTEPAKVKYYLKYGVPAVVSAVPVIARELAEREVSFAVNNTEEEIAHVVRKFITDEDLQKQYRENIIEYVKEIDVDRLLDRVVSETFSEFGVE